MWLGRSPAPKRCTFLPPADALPAGDFASTDVQGRLVSEMRYLASVVTQCFTAFGELLGMQKRFAELSGGVTRVSEMTGTLRAAAAQEATIRTIATADDITSASPISRHHDNSPCFLREALDGT